jgi:hypothetical protein
MTPAGKVVHAQSPFFAMASDAGSIPRIVIGFTLQTNLFTLAILVTKFR